MEERAGHQPAPAAGVAKRSALAVAEPHQRFVEAGCTYFVMNPICDNDDTERQFEQIAAEVIPRFASAGRAA